MYSSNLLDELPLICYLIKCRSFDDRGLMILIMWAACRSSGFMELPLLTLLWITSRPLNVIIFTVIYSHTYSISIHHTCTNMYYTTHAYSHFVIKAYELYVVLVIFDKEKNLLLYNIYFKVILLRNQKVVTCGVKMLIIILVWIRIATIFKYLVLS